MGTSPESGAGMKAMGDRGMARPLTVVNRAPRPVTGTEKCQPHRYLNSS